MDIRRRGGPPLDRDFGDAPLGLPQRGLRRRVGAELRVGLRPPAQRLDL